MLEQEVTGAIPSVSIVLLAYNQEAMVEHAVASLFAQDYPRLEVVLSDDCSTDHTHARLQRLAQDYRGSINVKVYRTVRNRGILSHALEAIAQTSGDIVVLAAGDDISYPHRVRTSVETLLRQDAVACYSKYDFIDADGQIWARNVAIRDLSMMLRDYFQDVELEPIHGASSAFRRSVFTGLEPLDTPVFFEDTFFTLSITLRGGRIAFIDDALVQVRHHSGSVTNHVLSDPDIEALRRQEDKQLVYAGSMLAVLRHFAPRIVGRPGQNMAAKNALNDDLALFHLRANWVRGPVSRLWRALPVARRRGHLGWLVPRLVGLPAFLRMKRLKHGLLRQRGRLSRPGQSRHA